MPINDSKSIKHPLIAGHITSFEYGKKAGEEFARTALGKHLETSPFGHLGITFQGINADMCDHVIISAPRGLDPGVLERLLDRVSCCFPSKYLQQVPVRQEKQRLQQSA